MTAINPNAPINRIRKGSSSDFLGNKDKLPEPSETNKPSSAGNLLSIKTAARGIRWTLEMLGKAVEVLATAAGGLLGLGTYLGCVFATGGILLLADLCAFICMFIIAPESTKLPPILSAFVGLGITAGACAGGLVKAVTGSVGIGLHVLGTERNGSTDDSLVQEFKTRFQEYMKPQFHNY